MILSVLMILGGCHAHTSDSAELPTQSQEQNGIQFVDVAAQSGIHTEFHIAGKRPITILQGIGNGCAFFDYDNDGNQDILLVGPTLTLYKGDGHGHFTDVTQQTGLDKLHGHFLGCAVGDYDNDGYDDLYISGYRTGILLHNDKGRHFTDVTKAAGLRPQPWGTSAGFADLSGQGYLDLVVANYLQFSDDPQKSQQLCMRGTLLSSCDPIVYPPEHPVFYHNLGRGKFRDETITRGFDKTSGKGLGIAFADCIGKSGLPAVFIANDMVASDLMVSDAKGRFQNRAIQAGVALSQNGQVHSAMGVDWGDYNQQGRFDVVVGTFDNQDKSLYANTGNGIFEDVSDIDGLDAVHAPYVTFGAKWIDYDNDGWLDLLLTNGHIEDNVQQISPTKRYRNPLQVFHNLGGKTNGQLATFTDVTSQLGSALQKPIVGRGLATGDFDNDGRIDALVIDSEGPPLLLHNQGGHMGHWLGVRLIGTRSNRDGYGAVLTAQIGANRLVTQCQSAGSYLSASDKRVHFGLAGATSVDSLSVRWPSGQISKFSHLKADHYITIREGAHQIE